MTNNETFLPTVKVYPLPGNASTYVVGPMHLASGSDSAYLFDPEGETPYEVHQTGQWNLSLNAAQARAIRDQLNAMDL